jgi:membrane protein implicated in regulation of membrane protease activity
MSGYFLLGGVFVIAWIYSLFSVITGEFKNSNNKLVWIALLIFLPISAFLYLFIGRKQLVEQDTQNDEDSAFEDKIEKVTTFYHL